MISPRSRSLVEEARGEGGRAGEGSGEPGPTLQRSSPRARPRLLRLSRMLGARSRPSAPPPPSDSPPVTVLACMQAAAEQCAAVLGRRPVSFVRAASGEGGTEAPAQGEGQWWTAYV